MPGWHSSAVAVAAAADPGPDAASGARQRILAFANLVCTVAVFREPGPRSVKEAVAECDRVEVRGTKEPLLNLLVGADTGGNRGSRIRRECVGFDGETLTGAVEEPGGLHHIPPSPGGQGSVQDVASAGCPMAPVAPRRKLSCVSLRVMHAPTSPK